MLKGWGSCGPSQEGKQVQGLTYADSTADSASAAQVWVCAGLTLCRPLWVLRPSAHLHQRFRLLEVELYCTATECSCSHFGRAKKAVPHYTTCTHLSHADCSPTCMNTLRLSGVTLMSKMSGGACRDRATIGLMPAVAALLRER